MIRGVFASIFLLLVISASAQRYLTPVFSSTIVTSGLDYGQNTGFDGFNQTLKLDLFEPQGDSVDFRPCLIYAHGGGFTDPNQDRMLPHIANFCDSLARRGYVAASIDYRLDTSISNRSVISAMHDFKAAVRYLKHHASTLRIDTNLIFVAGESAGAVTALNVAYVNDANEVLFPPTLPSSSDSSVDGLSGNPSYSSTPKAVLSFCGGTETVLGDLLFDPMAINSSSDPALVMVHGSADPLIPIAKALDVAVQANALGLPNLFFNMPGATHCPWFTGLPNNVAYLDTLISYAVPFLYSCTLDAQQVKEAESTPFVIFPNPSNGLLNLQVYQEQYERIRIYSLLGELKKDIAFTTQLDLSFLAPGQYQITLISKQRSSSKRLIIH